MRIALVPNADRPRALDIAKRVIDLCDAHGVTPLATSIEDASLLGIDAAEPAAESGIDLVMAVGGDGTVLKGAQIALASDAPIFGINAGRLGFLADGAPADLEDTLDRLVERDWPVSERMTVQASLDGVPGPTGLNDVVIEKMESQRLVYLDVWIDDNRFLTYRADGLVVATPTGSTAYNLSVGGPLVDPEGAALILTPVAPHSLFSRSIVLPAERVVRLEVLEDRPVGVNVDGIDVGSVEAGGIIEVRKGASRVRFVELSGRWFGTVIKQKFHLE